jgi:hypothetical protein
MKNNSHIPLLVTQHAHERRNISHNQMSVDELKISLDMLKKGNWSVVLFGSCGALDIIARYDYLISPRKWFNKKGDVIIPERILPVEICGSGFTADHSVRDPFEVEQIKSAYQDCVVVDQESVIIGRMCQDAGIPFQSVRYVIDGCHRRIMPPVINHFWREYQHRRMHGKMNRLLKEYQLEQ